ncbi:unnamed protein product [Paramecium sonneborni]|uniref:WD40-repeat-containing domain n=1 Tax=Paramecium sonneborni TaxID=65129 RepID=A0A8S1KNE5_9CILI|nr:unnamed protein product [Paramecium sonneborni]
MIQSKMIEKEMELECSMNHKRPIEMVIWDKNLEKDKRFLCKECLDDNQEQNLNSLISFEKLIQLIEEYQKKKLEYVDSLITMNIKQIQTFQKKLLQLKQHIIQQLDQLIWDSDEWIKSFYQIGQKNVTYSIYEELDNLINKDKFEQFNYQPLIHQIKITNHSWNQKILQKLKQFSAFELNQKIEQILINFEKINQEEEIIKKINSMEVQYEIDNIKESTQQFQNNNQLEQGEVEFKLIDDLNNQANICYAIVFNNCGSIMVSTDYTDIIIWDFIQGRLKQSNRFSVHHFTVNCLVYSKKTNSFISGSWDKSIISWKQINQNEWKWSQPYQQHIDYIQCLILNKQEDQLISGGYDDSIKVWKVDFMNNQLTYLYSLDNTYAVYSLCYNESETILASCAKSNFLIWKEGLEGKWELQCKQKVSDGYQIFFIKDQQFLWVTREQNIDEILIFELQDGIFKQNKNKTLQLIKNDQCEDYWILFRTIHNKEKNVILIRHKHHIYLIRIVNENDMKIIGQLNCEIEDIFGTMTDDAQYLVFWDHKQQKYLSFELVQK